jgi:hypothetical protein
MDKVNKAILDSKIISRREAERIAKYILHIINVNLGELKGDIVLNTLNYLKDRICIRIGQYYMFRPLEEFNSNILSELSYICGRIIKNDFNNFKKYVEYNYRGLTMIDIFEEKEKVLQRVKDGQKYSS